MKKLLTTALMIATLVACQKSEETPDVGASSEVVFTSDISTRATDTSWDAGDEIGVFMYYTGLTDLCDSNSENVLYTTSGGSTTTFTSSDPLLYPENYNVDFIAYHPHTTDYSDYTVTLNTADQSSETKVKAQDFMVASAQNCNESNAPSLSFTRKMSKIVINVDRKDSRANAVLSDISLNNAITDGTFFIVNSPAYRENASVTAGTTTSDIALFFNETSSTIEAIIIPQEGVTSKLHLVIDGEEFTASISGTFAENKQYNYNLSIGVDEVIFTEGSIIDWSEVQSGDIETTQLLLSYVQFKRNESNTANITKVDDLGVIESLLSKFRRCLMTTDGEGNATICYLDNNNSTLYSDGTTAAALDGTEGDVMVYFPEYWYKYENVDNDYFRYHFSESEKDGYIHVEASLVGAYKAYNESNKVYSRSGVLPTNSVSQSDFKSYAAKRGEGYQIIDYDQHCTIAMMLYAKYLGRDTQDKLGYGSAGTSTYTGLTNSLGNSDGASTWVNGLGIEGVYGGVYEWIEGVEVNKYVWKITNPTEDTTRTVTAGSSSGWITALAMESGEYFDMVPTATGGSEATYYADYYFGSSSSSERVVYRSHYYSYTHGGVSYANASCDSSDTYTSFGSRLAFRGTITEAASVDDYKALLSK